MEKMAFSPSIIDKSWTLFLDRDGVINVEIVGSYVTKWSEFEFCDGAVDALANLNDIFGNILVVTNQRGVGKGIMSMDDLKDISMNMKRVITDAGGRIDKVYAATSVQDNDHNRKPQTGMGLQAQQDYPHIDFSKSIMVGNTMSDIEFGKRLGMHTIFITTKYEPVTMPHDLIDEQYESLKAWSNTLVTDAVIGC